MSQLAVSVLTTPTDGPRLTALRQWALNVLDNPMNIEPLSDELREQLIAHFSTSISETNTIDESLNPTPDLIIPEFNPYDRLANGTLESNQPIPATPTVHVINGELSDYSELLERYEEQAQAINDLENEVVELQESAEPHDG